MTTKISMLAIDLAKGSFQVCAVGPGGMVIYNRALSRSRLIALLADQPACVVAMEACATSHHWGRVAQTHGHEVRLVPAVYVKPFVKRQKNDRADAEAIAEAALRPAMRFVAVKSVETQGRAVAFRTHQCLVRQRTQLINALRGHLAEFGLVAPKGPASLKVLENALADEASELPAVVREMGTIYLDQIARITEVIERLADEPEKASKTDTELRRLSEQHTGPWRHQGHIKRPDTRPIEDPAENRRFCLPNRGHPHTPRVCRRPLGLSHAAMSGFSSIA